LPLIALLIHLGEFLDNHLGEFLENALKFERMAAEATDPRLKEALEKQAQAYRKMAAKRAERLGLPAPNPPINQMTPTSSRDAGSAFSAAGLGESTRAIWGRAPVT